MVRDARKVLENPSSTEKRRREAEEIIARFSEPEANAE
jgi:hypothetical protein